MEPFGLDDIMHHDEELFDYLTETNKHKAINKKIIVINEYYIDKLLEHEVEQAIEDLKKVVQTEHPGNKTNPYKSAIDFATNPKTYTVTAKVIKEVQNKDLHDCAGG